MSKRPEASLQHQPAFDAAAPLVATFRNGPPPPNKRSDLAFEVFENPSKKQRLVVASADKVAYQGANFGYLSAANDCASYAVGVFDKRTGEVRVCNVDQIYVMQQTIKGASDNVDDNRGADKSYMDQRRDLVEVFGSKKSKRMQKSREENMVNLDNISGAATLTQTLQKKVDTAQKELLEAKARDAGYSSAAAALAATRNQLLPPCDVDAPTPDRVYNLRKFIEANVMDALKIQAELVIDALATSSVADYSKRVGFTALPTRLLLSLPTPYDVTKVAYVVYISYLIDLANTRFPIRKSAAALAEEKDAPLVLVRHLLKLFTESTQNDKGHMTYLQPKTHKDKLVLYLLVVALTVNEFSLDLTEVGTDLKRSPVVLSSYCRQLGCIVEKAKTDAAVYGGSIAAKKQSVTRVVLAVPLHFPPPKRGAGPRR